MKKTNAKKLYYDSNLLITNKLRANMFFEKSTYFFV